MLRIKEFSLSSEKEDAHQLAIFSALCTARLSKLCNLSCENMANVILWPCSIGHITSIKIFKTQLASIMFINV